MEELKEAALRVIEGRSDGLGPDFMGDVLKVIEERNALLKALQEISAINLVNVNQYARGWVEFAQGVARSAVAQATGDR